MEKLWKKSTKNAIVHFDEQNVRAANNDSLFFEKNLHFRLIFCAKFKKFRSLASYVAKNYCNRGEFVV